MSAFDQQSLQILAKVWERLTEIEKKPFEKMAESDQARYDKEIKQYCQSGHSGKFGDDANDSFATLVKSEVPQTTTTPQKTSTVSVKTAVKDESTYLTENSAK